MILRVIVAAQDRSLRNRIARLLASDGVLLTPAPSLRRVMAAPEAQTCDFIVTAATSSDPDPSEALEVTVALPGRPDVVCLTTGEDRSGDARLLTAGAIAVVPIGLSDDELGGALRSLLQRRRAIHPRVDGAASPPDHPPPRSLAMRELLALADRVAVGDSSVLIMGETGTGKEWLARRIHAGSRRLAGPFVPVNCAAIPEGLVESELFGHTKGAFTGAVRSRRGSFELSHGGTLFLDEVADVSLTVQVKLLRVLQDRTFQPVGGEQAIHADVRIVAATNRHVEEAVATGIFRQDLYYRLAVITLHMPPLRERPEDVPDLVDAYAWHFATRWGRPVPEVTPSAREALMSYSWPGNVRELINVVERTVLLASGPTLGLVDLPTNMWAEQVKDGAPTVPQASRYSLPTSYEQARAEALAGFEVRYLSVLLKGTHGRVGEAAKRAGMSPRSLYSKMKARGLRKEDFRG